jgi:uncharacterized protein YbjT (DUF2867 family)
VTVGFVAGATGYTGREVVRLLIGRGVETVAHVRPDSRRLEEWRERFGTTGAKLDTTPWEPEAMGETLARVRPATVFGLLGTTRARGASYQTVDYGLTALLLRAAMASGVRPKFIYLSSAGVRAASTNGYLAVRWRLEQELQASGLPYVIARPSFITGPDRDEFRAGERIAARVTDGLLTVAGALGAKRIRDRYRSTTNTILAGALVRLALDPTAAAAVVESEDLRA